MPENLDTSTAAPAASVDPLSAPPPELTLDEAAALARELFGVEGSASRLHSERDANLRVDAGSGAFVLKVYNAAEQEAVVDMQTSAMLHVAAHEPEIAVPRILPLLGGEELYGHVELGGRRHAVQLMTFCDGRVAGPRSFDEAELRVFGGAVAQVGRALRSFFHPAAERALLWDAKHAGGLRALVAGIQDGDRAAAAAAALDRFEERALPSLGKLRWQVIHNDLTHDNLLVDAELRPVSAIDFGDMTHSPLLFDVAVALAPFCSEPGLFDRVEAFVRGYGEMTPLEEIETELLADAVSARLAASVLISAWRVRRFPDNSDYITAFDADTWPVLELFAELGPGELRRRFRRAAAPAVSIGVGSPPVATGDLDGLLERRRRAFGPAMLPLTYERPLHVVRGEGVWLETADGHRYLDAYNNVPAVGHSHPRVVDAIARQARLLNTNSRYLHTASLDLAERLVATLPDGLDACLFVNSGSEANDLAWRFATSVTGAGGGLVSEWAYHGVTAVQTDFSPSEWSGERPAYVGTVAAPGRTTAEEAAAAAIGDLAGRGFSPAAFFLDSAWTSDGVHTDADAFEYEAGLVAHVREAGGLFVADEVQAGFGRLGSGLWSFAAAGVEPDFVTLGKPMGNGHPVAAMICRTDLAEEFARTQAPVFSTFGGNPVACAAALAVLDVIEEEDLVTHVDAVGVHLRRGLDEIATRHEAVTAVRGAGLLYGVQLEDAETAARVQNGMRDRGVLIGVTGPGDDVLKIRPPLVFRRDHADRLVAALDETLAAG